MATKKLEALQSCLDVLGEAEWRDALDVVDILHSMKTWGSLRVAFSDKHSFNREKKSKGT